MAVIAKLAAEGLEKLTSRNNIISIKTIPVSLTTKGLKIFN